MFKLLLGLCLIFLPVTASAVFASELTISKTADFSNPTTSFSSGETVYVRISANSDGSKKHDLNLRDNNYNLISTYNLEKLHEQSEYNLQNQGNNQFLGSLTAPQDSGLYSLEARIESESSVTSSVRTIKVGSSTNSNVKVQVKVNTSNSPSPKSPSPDASPGPTDGQSESPQPETSPSPVENTDNNQKTLGLFAKVFSFFERIFAGIF